VDFKRLRWLFILPVTLFVGLFEWVRHYPLHEFMEDLFPGWQENFFSVIFMMALIAVFSHKLFMYIKRLSQELMAEREKLRLVIEHSADAILVLGSDKIIKTINPAATQLLHWRTEEVGGRYRCNEILKCHDRHDKQLCDLACLTDTAWSTGMSSSNIEVSIYNRYGQLVPVSISCSVIPSTNGQEDATIMVIRDLRDEKRLEEEVEALAKITRRAPGQTSMEEVLSGLVNKIAEVTKVNFVMYTMVDDGQTRLGAHTGLKDDLDTELLQKTHDIEQAVIKTGKVEILAEKGFALVTHPVHCCSDILIGVITCGRLDGPAFTVPELNTLAHLVEQGAMVLENFLLYRKVQDGATLDERYRLAREIHDGLAQGLGYLNLRSKLIADRLKEGKIEEAAFEIDQLRQVIKELYQETRTSIFDLKIIPADGEDFAAYLKNYLSRFAKQTSTSTKLVLPEETIKLTQKTELHMIRIIQEALANVRKHANATEVEVVVSKSPSGLRVQIKDNGIGFTAPKAGQVHFGLAIMQERAALIGATVSLTQGDPGGTVVTVDLPTGRGGDGYGTD